LVNNIEKPFEMDKSVQAQSQATPIYILRGHASPIHALHIYSQNLRLVSGDANGWVVVWDLVTKRPVTAWKAHEGAILEARGFNIGEGVTEIYTYGDSTSFLAILLTSAIDMAVTTNYACGSLDQRMNLSSIRRSQWMPTRPHSQETKSSHGYSIPCP
jgi:WD40 repeat protein